MTSSAIDRLSESCRDIWWSYCETGRKFRGLPVIVVTTKVYQLCRLIWYIFRYKKLVELDLVSCSVQHFVELDVVSCSVEKFGWVGFGILFGTKIWLSSIWYLVRYKNLIEFDLVSCSVQKFGWVGFGILFGAKICLSWIWYLVRYKNLVELDSILFRIMAVLTIKYKPGSRVSCQDYRINP
jgi:hypothetical protein